MSHGIRLSLVLAGMVAASLFGSHAQAADPAMAEAIFQNAKQLADEGRWSEACPKFQASFELDEQLGTLLNLAHCWEQAGRVATAWARWEEAQTWAERVGDDRLEWIRERQAKVTPRLPHLVVRVNNPVESLSVLHGDTAIPAPSFGIPLPVDPGRIQVRVRRGAEVLEEKEVVAEEGKQVELTLDLAAIDAAHPVRTDAPEPAPARPQPVAPPEPYDPTHRNVGIVVGAVGLAAVLTAAGLEIAALIKKNQADAPDACQNGFCSDEGLEAAEQGATFAEVGQWLGIGGLVTLAVGVTIFLTAPDDETTAAGRAVHLAIRPWGGARGGGLGLEGSW